MNSRMEDVVFTARDGQVTHLEAVYIRGSKIRYAFSDPAAFLLQHVNLNRLFRVFSTPRFFVLPDMLKNAPMFKKSTTGIAIGATSFVYFPFLLWLCLLSHLPGFPPPPPFLPFNLLTGRGKSAILRAQAAAKAGQAAGGRGRGRGGPPGMPR